MFAVVRGDTSFARGCLSRRYISQAENVKDGSTMFMEESQLQNSSDV